MYGRLFTSVLILFVVLSAIQLYELCIIKSKGGFHDRDVVFSSTYQVLTKFHTEKFVLLSDERIGKILSIFQKRITVINVFIFNKLDFQNCFLAFQP